MDKGDSGDEEVGKTVREDSERERIPSEGHGRFSRGSIDSSISNWIESKEAKRTGSKRKHPRYKGLAKVSGKQRKRNSEYTEAKRSFLSREENRECSICKTRDGLSIHHVGKRLGEIANEELFMTLCMTSSYLDNKHPHLNHSHSGGCHGFVEGNKQWARTNGYLK